MQARLDHLLISAVDAWCLSGNTLPDHAKLIGSWRGLGDLEEFATAHPQDNFVSGEMVVPNCVVIAEYARRAVSSVGDTSQIDLLREQCQRVIDKMKPSIHKHRHVQTDNLVRGLTHGVLAGVEYYAKDHSSACKHLARAGLAYDAAWYISQERIGGQTTANSGVGEDVTIGDPALRLLDLAHRSGVFGGNGITQPTWLTLRHLLSHVFSVQTPPAICENRLKALTVRGDQVGKVIHLDIAKLAWPMANPFPFFDPLSFGITRTDPKMRSSIWLATRCCRQSAEWGTGVALRVRLDTPELANELGGDSAGALIAAGLIATLEEQKLDESKSTTSRLTITPSAKASKPGVEKIEELELSASDLEIKAIKGVVVKVNEAKQVGHGISEFFVHPDNAKQWQSAHPYTDYPKVTAVDSLAALRDGLWGDRELEEELNRHARAVHNLWDRASQAQNNASDQAQADDRKLEPIERDHRFECYVPPMFRIEGPLQPQRVPSETNDADTNDWELAGEESAKRSTEVLTREETPVPGERDEQLLHMLELSLRGRLWDGAPAWLKPRCGLVIYDFAGAGKTVCSYRLANYLTNPDHYQRLYGWRTDPLVVRLDGRWRRHLDGRLLSLRELLETIMAEEAKQTDPSQYSLVQRTVAYALKRNRVIVIVDGFDQFKPDEREQVVESYLNDHDGKKCRWIITSRVHAIDELRGQKRFFLDADWTRVRIDAFTEDQQEEYFSKGLSNGKPIGERWKDVLVDREVMAELLGLPMVLWMIRVLIEEADWAKQEPPMFYSLSQLYLVTSRKLLARALEKNQDEVNARLSKDSIPIPRFKNSAEQLEILEQVLSLFAFEMMLIGETNGRIEGNDLVARFEELCKRRYLWPIKQRFDKADPFDQDDIKKEREQAVIRWNWALVVLRTIELNHRSVTEAYGQSQLVFRSRKMLECHAARYLTRYANRWDVFASDDREDRPMADQELRSDELARLCAWNHTTDPEWKEIWLLAIDMPMEPIASTDQDGTVQGAVLDHAVTCESLSALFRQPKAFESREARPTELIYRAWHLFEIDNQILRERSFLRAGKLIRGEAIEEPARSKLGQQLLLGQRIGSKDVVQKRQQIINDFRDERSRAMVNEFDQRRDTILVDAEMQRRESISADEEVRNKQLAAWAQQTSYEKSHTFLQCPPQAWLEAYEVGEISQDPRINSAIKGHETFVFAPILMQATTVTRWQYRQFDPAFETCSDVAHRISQGSSAFGSHTNDDDFPIVCTDWFDAWVYCKWLGQNHRLPTEWYWELAARAGTTTNYHFGDGCNGSQANCNGNQPYGDGSGAQKLTSPPFLERATPVGWVVYSCNPWGLWDVHGNVWEWCENLYFYDRGDPRRVLRGGSWSFEAGDSGAGFRDLDWPDYRRFDSCFRVSLVPSGTED